MERLGELAPARPVRTYPALLSTHADALAWARAGASAGSIVVAEYQASPRGRAGLEWRVQPGVDLAFSMILRPTLPAEREGWLYTVAASGVADALGPETTIEWPDEIRRDGARVAAVGIHVELGASGSEWAVVSVLVPSPEDDRGVVLARTADAIETRAASGTTRCLADYLRRCETIGRTVRARLIPLGPGGPEVTGTAVTALTDGALVLLTEQERRIAVRPQNLGLLEDCE